jgi:hypothetical protein
MQLNVDPIVEQLVVQAARIRGIRPEEYAGQLLASAVASDNLHDAPAEELLSGFETLAESATGVVNYSPDFFTRGVIYGEHD